MSVLRTNVADLPIARNERVARGHATPDATLGAQRPGAVILGGEANALSVARELGRQGIAVYAISPEETCVRHSRYCEWLLLPPGGSAEERFVRFLLSGEADRLHGAVLIACSDAALRVLAGHRDALARRFRLDLADPSAQLDMLDKLRTCEIARAAGIDVPRFWTIVSADEARRRRDELMFPLMVKPRLSHLFEQRFGRKHMIAASFDELVAVLESVADSECDVMLVEVIPGDDDHLASYFTYIDEGGEPLYHYTKRVIRRYPAGMGATCYHITGDVPEIVEPSLRLLRAAGVRGLANVEFKRDPRDGRYKLIECNARFVASNALVASTGPRLATFVYQRATGGAARLSSSASRVDRPTRQWDPLRDFAAFCELRRAGQITLWQWLRSIAHRQTFPYFAWSDPGPTLSRFAKALRRGKGSRGGGGKGKGG